MRHAAAMNCFPGLGGQTFPFWFSLQCLKVCVVSRSRTAFARGWGEYTVRNSALATAMELAFISLVLTVILMQAIFLAVLPGTYIRLRNRLLRLPDQGVPDRGHRRERIVAGFIISLTILLLYFIVELILGELEAARRVAS